MYKSMPYSLLNKHLNIQKRYINTNGENLFELALKESLTKERKFENVKATELCSGNPIKNATLTYGQDSRISCIGVEYHNRWCFYLYDSKYGKTFITDFTYDKIKLLSSKIIKEELKVNNSYSDAILLAMINCEQLILQG